MINKVYTRAMMAGLVGAPHSAHTVPDAQRLTPQPTSHFFRQNFSTLGKTSTIKNYKNFQAINFHSSMQLK